MKLKYSPCSSTRETTIVPIDERSFLYDGELMEFSLEAVEWPNIAEESGYRILEAHLENGELYCTVLKRYVGQSEPWNSGQYHEVSL